MNNIDKEDYNIARASFIGARVLSKKDHLAFRKDTMEAIRSLTNKALETTQGRDFVNAVRRQDGHGKRDVAVAVGYSKEKGLCLRVSWIECRSVGEEKVFYECRAERVIATALEVFQSKVLGREEIGQFWAVAGKGRSDTLWPAEAETTKKEYYKFTAEKMYEPGSLSLESLVERVSNYIQHFFGSADIVSVCRNMTYLCAPVAVTAFGVFAIIGGSLLSVGGFIYALSKAEVLASAILHKSREKILVASADLLVGISALATGIVFIVQWAATFSKQILTAAAAGIALPYVALCLYVSGLASAIYKVYVGSKFQSELNEKLRSGDPTKEKEQLRAALQWIRAQTHLSEEEVEAHRKADGSLDEESLKKHLKMKWDKWILRTGAKDIATDFTKDLSQAKDLDKLIAALGRGDSKAIKEAKALIRDVQMQNKEHLKWNRIGILSNFIGLVGVITCLAFVGHIGAAVASVFFVIAAFIAIFVDSTKIRDLVQRLLAFLADGLALPRSSGKDDIVRAGLGLIP